MHWIWIFSPGVGANGPPGDGHGNDDQTLTQRGNVQ